MLIIIQDIDYLIKHMIITCRSQIYKNIISMHLVKKFETRTARVKGLCFHPTRPWVITSLHSGIIQIWDYNMNIVLATFDEAEGPVRGVDFHPHLPLFVSGADCGHIRVWNYKQKRCQFVLKGHIDYVRTTYFHHQLPWILSASDDQTMRIWNYQSRSCVNIITGHSHYVMCAQFHHQKNYIVSASLDSTIRIWDFSILRKKLTQTKAPTGYVGIEIECIKMLEGHQKGCNWVAFHPTTNLIASGSDDRKIKLWKYTNQVAWEYSTILGHKNNVSCVLFDASTQSLITNSEDKTLRIWNVEAKTQILTEKKPKSRFWILALNKANTLLGAGHDEGLDIYQLQKQRVPHVVISNQTVIYAKGFKTIMYDIKTKAEKQQLYQYKEKVQNSISFIEKMFENPFEKSAYLVQIIQSGLPYKCYMAKKKQAYLNFPNLVRQYFALDSCYISATHVAAVANEKQIHFLNLTKKQDDKQITFKSEHFQIKRIFPSNKPNQVMIVTGNRNSVLVYDHTLKKSVGQFIVQNSDVTHVIWGPNKVAIVSTDIVTIFKENFEKIVTIKEKFPIKSLFWESEGLIFYTTINHLKYGFMNGETGVLKTIDEPFHILKKIQGTKFLAFSKTRKIFEIQFPEYTEIQFKLAVFERKVDKIKMLLSKIGESKKKILVKHLVENGYANLALTLVTNLEEKFALAIQSSNFELAFKICNEVNTQQYWKMLGEQALKQGIFQAYELSCQKLKTLDQLNFLYSLQSNTNKLQKMLKINKDKKNITLAFNTNLFLNNGQVYEELLRDVGLQSLAELSREAHEDGQKKSDLLKRLKSRPLTPVQAVGQDNFSNWPHNIEEEEEDSA